MTTFERDLRREGHAVSTAGVAYRVSPEPRMEGHGWVTIPAPQWGAHETREQAIRWAVKDSGERP